MNASVNSLCFDGSLLNRGFWLYVWEITTANKNKYYYVGRTGDSSSAHAQSPFSRLSQHLGSNPNSAALRCHLKRNNIIPESCSFLLISYGPILPECDNMEKHKINRDIIAAQEKELANAMGTVGYTVLNSVACSKELDPALFTQICTAFSLHFPKLKIFNRERVQA